LPTPKEILQEYWKFQSFRPLQEEIIQSVLDGKDTLALLPTGGGKSICFQVPALYQEGICIVVSPLIALMKDQVEQLKKRNISAIAIYSGMRYQDIDRELDNCVYGHTKFLYLSPERLTTELARQRIAKMNVNLIAVDEAHSISQWGYDFRPSYLEIANIRELHPTVPVLALTATATNIVKEDIQDKLVFAEKNIFQKSFERKNISYVVLRENNKLSALLNIISKVNGSSIVYARSRKRTQDVAIFLQRNKIKADFYHAGLSPDSRSAKQDAWIQNKTRVIVATKPDVRTVVHIDLPNSLEAYFQEAGRAGRDEAKAYAVLIYDEVDKLRLERTYEQAFPDMKTIRQVYRALGSYLQLAVGGGIGKSYDFDIGEFIKTFNLEVVKTYNCLKILEQSGWLILSESIYLPATLRVKVDREKLYDYQLRNKKLDRVIKKVLQLYQGVFNYPIKIKESQLAYGLKMPVKEVVQSLKKLQQDGIVQYAPQKDKPQLIFLKERVPVDNLVIDQVLFKFRKERFGKNIKAAIQYAEKNSCRSKQLLAYFGEINAPLCGQCDVCLGRNKPDIQEGTYEKYKQKIFLLLKKEALTASEIKEAFSPKRQEQVMTTITFLLEEGIIEVLDNQKIRWVK